MAIATVISVDAEPVEAYRLLLRVYSSFCVKAGAYFLLGRPLKHERKVVEKNN